jgi:hypothetical protein
MATYLKHRDIVIVPRQGNWKIRGGISIDRSTARMAAQGHEDRFRPPSLNGRYRLGEATFARASGNDEVAPMNEPARAGGEHASWSAQFRRG